MKIEKYLGQSTGKNDEAGNGHYKPKSLKYLTKLGQIPQLSHVEREALEKVNMVLNVNDKPGGFHVVHSNHDELKQRVAEGYTFIAYGDDMVFFAETIASETDFISSLRK